MNTDLRLFYVYWRYVQNYICEIAHTSLFTIFNVTKQVWSEIETHEILLIPIIWRNV